MQLYVLSIMVIYSSLIANKLSKSSNNWVAVYAELAVPGKDQGT